MNEKVDYVIQSAANMQDCKIMNTTIQYTIHTPPRTQL